MKAIGLTLILILLSLATSHAAEPTFAFSGKDLSGWKFRPGKDAKLSKWVTVASVKLAADNPGRFTPTAGTGILLSGEDGKGVDLLSEAVHGDCELQVEFNVTKGSNSGIYFQGQYEVQILDSFGKQASELKFGDCGGIYNTAAPKVNASKAPGDWQSLSIVFRAPRFDNAGKKTENAKFVKVSLNGTLLHENVEVKGPTTSALGGPEKPVGPLLLQGDHGPVAFRNLVVKKLEK